MTETQISGNHRDGIETLYAAEAGLDIALSDLRSAFWKDVLLGTSVSTFTDGPASGLRTLPDRTVIDLASDAPKGPSGRPWLLYAYGPLAGMLGIGGGDTPHYLTIWVTGDPMAAEEALVLRATAHGRGGSRRNVELTIRRSPVGDSAEKPPEIERVLWRER